MFKRRKETPAAGVAKSGEARISPADRVGQLGENGDFQRLAQALSDPDRWVRKEAAHLLGALALSLQLAREHGLTMYRLQPDKNGLLLELGMEPGATLPDPDSFAHARQILCEPLIAALGDEEEVRKYAADALAVFGDDRAVDPLIALVEDGGVGAGEAAGALADLEATRALGAIVRLADTGGSGLGGQLDRARKALHAFGESAIPPLIEYFEEHRGQVGWEFIRFLGGFFDTRMAAAMVSLVGDREAGPVRGFALEALSLGGMQKVIDPSTVEVLRAVAEDGSDPIRREAGKLLRGLGEPYESPDRKKHSPPPEPGSPEAVLAGLEQGGDVGAMIEALHAETGPLRDAVIKLLGRTGDPRALEPLVTVLREAVGSGDRKTMDKVKHALEAFGSGAEKAVVAALTDPNATVRWVVADTLGRIGTRASLPALKGALDDTDEGVREAAAGAMERVQSHEVST